MAIDGEGVITEGTIRISDAAEGAGDVEAISQLLEQRQRLLAGFDRLVEVARSEKCVAHAKELLGLTGVIIQLLIDGQCLCVERKCCLRLSSCETLPA